MGTPPQVKIRAATLAGGRNNQDRYSYGDGWAVVLDGASSLRTQIAPKTVGGTQINYAKHSADSCRGQVRISETLPLRQLVNRINVAFKFRTANYTTIKL